MSQTTNNDPCQRQCNICPIHAKAVCSALTQAELDSLDGFSYTRLFQTGETIYHQGTQPGFFGTVKQGLVTRWQNFADGRRQLVDIIFPGGHLGELEGRQSAFELICSSPAAICYIQDKRMTEILQTFPAMETKLRQLREQELEEARLQLARLGRLSAKERLLSFFDKIARLGSDLAANENMGAGQITLNLHLKRGDIAHYLGIELETMSRKFAELKKQGIIIDSQGQALHLQKAKFQAALAQMHNHDSQLAG